MDPASRTRKELAMMPRLGKIESWVVVLLAEGMSVCGIAVPMGREESRGPKVQHIFAERGLSTRAELVWFVLSVVNAPVSRD